MVFDLFFFFFGGFGTCTKSSVSNAYTDEKAAAIHCLGELAFQCALFYPKEIPSDTDITSYASMLFDANVSGEIPLVWEWPCLSMFIVHAVQLLSQHGLDHYHYSVRRNTCRTLARLFLCCPLPSQTLSEMKESGQVLMPGDPHSQLFSFVAPRVRHLLCRCAMEDGHPLVAASAVQSLAEIVECRASDENTESVATGARSSRIAPLAYPASAIRSVFVFGKILLPFFFLDFSSSVLFFSTCGDLFPFLFRQARRTERLNSYMFPL